MYIMPQPYKCIKCDHEFNFSPHAHHTAPMTSENNPVCPKCWDEFLRGVGIGYGTTVWSKAGSEYGQIKSRIEDLKAEWSQDCWCHKCNANKLVSGLPFPMTRMILCPDCGNKRCPKASDHKLECTNSNDVNQAGSVYSSEYHRSSSASGRPPALTNWYQKDWYQKVSE